MRKGLLIVYTGNGKGKTTAAFGLALRGIGHGFKAAIFQFIKSRVTSGECAALKAFEGQAEIQALGKGFIRTEKDRNSYVITAQKGWKRAMDAVVSGRFDIVVLDEFTYLLSMKFLDENEVLTFLRARPARVHIVITGRDAPEGLIALADCVTEMRNVKHPYAKGIKAQRGIEF